jgi:hypothetical protein
LWNNPLLYVKINIKQKHGGIFMSRKDNFWDDLYDYLRNPFHDARQFEDYDEWMEEDEITDDEYNWEQFEDDYDTDDY